MEWIKGEVIGRGSFGTINLARLNGSNSTQASLAVKSSPILNSDSLRNEKKVLTELGKQNRHIIQYFGDRVSEEKGTQIYNLFLEYASKGSLADYLRKPEAKFGNLKDYIRGILHGLCHVHDNGFVHCDVKLQNVLVFEDGLVKLADFGLAKRVEEERENGEGLRGTPMYMAPEMMVGEVVTPAVDVWAVGCAVVEMVSGFPAWEMSPESDVSGLFYRVGVKGECPRIPMSLCDDGRDFLGKCFEKNPSERWTARMLLEHPFLSGGDIGSLSEESDVSPKCPFDFPDWESSFGSDSSSSSSSSSVECFDHSVSFDEMSEFSSRFDREIVTDCVPDWNGSASDGWITIR